MFRVLDPGLLTTFQDEGRAGHAHLGVPPSGAADLGSYRLANRLVGNAWGAAVLETTQRGPRLCYEHFGLEDARADPRPETDLGSGSGRGPGAGAAPGPSRGPGAPSGAGLRSDLETGVLVGPVPGAVLGAGPGPGWEVGSGPGWEVGSGRETGSGSGLGSGTGLGSGWEAGAGLGSGWEVGAGLGSGWEVGAGREMGARAGSGREGVVRAASRDGAVRARGGAVWMAVTGAPAPVRLDGRPAPFDAAFRVRPGQVVEVGTVTAGLRSYLAVSGGFGGEPVLGSRSSDVLSGLGPVPLATGDRLTVKDPRSGPDRAMLAEYAFPPGIFREPVLELVPGPRADWFTEEALRTLVRTTWTVSPTSNRVGLRLTGAELERLRTEELPSEGTVTGSIQVPGNGLPVLFLNDHPVTGGYPVIGVVTRAALDRAAQAAPGTSLRFSLRGR